MQMPARMPRAAPYLFATTRMDDDWLEQIKDTRSVINKEHEDRCVNVLFACVSICCLCVLAVVSCERLFLQLCQQKTTAVLLFN